MGSVCLNSVVLSLDCMYLYIMIGTILLVEFVCYSRKGAARLVLGCTTCSFWVECCIIWVREKRCPTVMSLCNRQLLNI